MRILIVSFVFPPYNIIGAVRVGKTAKYLARSGHDVRVIAAGNLEFDSNLELEIPNENVVYTPWSDVDRAYRYALAAANWVRRRLPRRVASEKRRDLRRDPAPADFNSEGPQADARTIAWWARLVYRDVFHIPDEARGWRRHAVPAGFSLMRAWRPDVILASGAPWTSFTVASDLSRGSGVPWVADFRDLWSGNHTTFYSEWRKRLVDARYERRIIHSAAALVTVSEPLAERLRADHPGKPVSVVLNGFDQDDYASNEADRRRIQSDSPHAPASEHALTLVYTGEINRNMRPLLQGIRALGEDARHVRLEIVGPQSENVRDRYNALAESWGIDDQISWRSPVSHAAACRRQQEADVLVLMMHDTAKDVGVYTGKLFEYIGARRPILLAGATTGVAAQLIRSRRLGYAEAAPERIAEVLRGWIKAKCVHGRISAPDTAGIEDLSREAQTRVYAAILKRVASR
jgi:glycosyltransferase involved in cell wall biosynthesis